MGRSAPARPAGGCACAVCDVPVASRHLRAAPAPSRSRYRRDPGRRDRRGARRSAFLRRGTEARLPALRRFLRRRALDVRLRDRAVVRRRRRRPRRGLGRDVHEAPRDGADRFGAVRAGPDHAAPARSALVDGRPRLRNSGDLVLRAWSRRLAARDGAWRGPAGRRDRRPRPAGVPQPHRLDRVRPALPA